MIETKEKRQKKIRDDRKIARKRWEEEKEKAINLGLPMPKKPRTKVFQITLFSRKVYNFHISIQLVLKYLFSNSSFASFAVATVLNLAPQKE